MTRKEEQDQQLNDSRPEGQSFCHFLKIKGFTASMLFPGETFTDKQERACNSIVSNCLRGGDNAIKIGFHQSFFCKGSPANKAGYGFRPFNYIRLKLEKQGLIETIAKKSYNTTCHIISTIKGTSKLFKLLSKYDKDKDITFIPDFVFLLKGKVAVLDKERSYILIKNPNTPYLKEIRSFMESYHQQLSLHSITCKIGKRDLKALQEERTSQGKAPLLFPDYQQKYPIVIFSDNVKTGGRLYKSWWTNCNKELRQYLKIDYQRCVEIDFSAMHPQILYQLEGYPPQDNIYLFDKKEKPVVAGRITRRDIAKKLMLSLINIEDKGTIKQLRSQAINAVIKDFKKEEGVSLNYPLVAEILKALEERNQDINSYFYSSAWRKCQTIEADLIRSIIKEALKREIIVLSVHDSIICKLQDQDKLEEIIKSKTALKYKITPLK